MESLCNEKKKLLTPVQSSSTVIKVVVWIKLLVRLNSNLKKGGMTCLNKERRQ
ncbi:hypothetical protein ACWI_07770 [Acetobacterium wieringae]|uniref:Uncharacterized protein n=1 Tax=Acetobacterium wieringae TaxID=52694 RepID=A0A1F2PK83_9FIRM|nr:hypothetical protein ACWI_07770 [Acetobacterium wieringae]